MQSTLTPDLMGRSPTDIRSRQSVAAPSLLARIGAHAARSAGALALADGSAQLTYADLNRRADRMAAYLLGRGLSAGSCALLLLDRGVDFVVSALAVMKTGAAYVPMDSSTPGDRAAFVLADAGAKVVLTHRGKGAGIAGNANGLAVDIIELDGPGADRIFNTDPKNLPSGPGRDDLAYIVYTSGSTGRPKGVEITHANLNGLIDWHQGAFDVTAADRAAHVAGLGFDATAWELWPHLTAGASVHIADEATRRSPQALHDWLISERISIAFVPTVITEQLIEMSWPADTSLRTLLTGGEQLHRRPPSGLPFALINNYGPSECTVVATSGPVAPRGGVDESPSIGRPIGDTVALVLDENLQQVGAGQPGELCLAGTLVGRGYRNNPAATAARFVNYSSITGGFEVRVYRTGDRVKMLENGEIVFLGRLDDQVKIRGYRIEPGEIVSWLDKLPSVAASAAMVRAGADGDELVAYIVWKSAPHQNATELRKYLSGRLPDYMLPARFVELASLPMTANSKVDRSALPAPAPGNLISDGAPAATEIASANAGVEGRIAAIIASLLGRTSVAAGDNFFLLGGHSMMGVRLASRLREDFGVKLTLRQLFATPTVAGLSATVSRMIDAAATMPGATPATTAPIHPVNPGS